MPPRGPFAGPKCLGLRDAAVTGKRTGDLDPGRAKRARAMTLQNRVMPTGEIVADPARGMFMGNRGILHDRDRRLGTARWKHPHWVCCLLSFKGRRREPMSPGAYTELFFLDEAVALAAGHRPCAECRRADYRRFRAAFETAHGPVEGAPTLDRLLHAARVTRRRSQITHRTQAANLPDGSFVMLDDAPWLVRGGWVHRFTPSGYAGRQARPTGPVTVLTPAPTVAALGAGYVPVIHESATR